MKPSLLFTTLTALVQLQRTVCIESSPGTGKTSIVRQVADKLGLNYIEHHLPTMLVEDFGIPVIGENTLRYTLPEWYPAIGSRHDDGKGGILCFDDRNQASPDLQKVLANICQARTLHGVPLASGWTVVSTGNRQSDRAGANRVLSHLRNRETVLDMSVDTDDWSIWAMNAGINDMVRAFIRFKPSLLSDFDPQRDMNPTPRSWAEGVAPIVGKVPAEAEFDVIKGSIGEGAATEFVAFMRVWRSMTQPDAILMNPTTAAVPTEVSARYAVTMALADRANTKNIDRVFIFLDRLPDTCRAEFIAVATRTMLARDPALACTKTMIDVQVKYSSRF